MIQIKIKIHLFKSADVVDQDDVIQLERDVTGFVRIVEPKLDADTLNLQFF